MKVVFIYYKIEQARKQNISQKMFVIVLNNKTIHLRQKALKHFHVNLTLFGHLFDLSSYDS